MSANRSFLHINSLNVRLGRFYLDNVSLSCGKGEYHILMGPSGSGKSTLMKCILGFHKIQSGSIFLDDNDITDELPERRRMGYVPQNYALFPHLNVEENLKFALRAAKVPAGETDTIVNRLCGILKIEKLRKRAVQNLSGGEKQKVALGRALGARPELVPEADDSLDVLRHRTDCTRRKWWSRGADGHRAAMAALSRVSQLPLLSGQPGNCRVGRILPITAKSDQTIRVAAGLVSSRDNFGSLRSFAGQPQ